MTPNSTPLIYRTLCTYGPPSWMHSKVLVISFLGGGGMYIVRPIEELKEQKQNK